uniref:Kazal-like domain-containing protein n=1 Tax=Timema bartmani TaxID=61472 RepID=A0A7R9F5R2_9NEOP|nr:unnamed protein product [Timema bartmani]
MSSRYDTRARVPRTTWLLHLAAWIDIQDKRTSFVGVVAGVCPHIPGVEETIVLLEKYVTLSCIESLSPVLRAVRRRPSRGDNHIFDLITGMLLLALGITTGDVPVFSTVCLCLVRGEDIQFHNRLPGVNREYLSTELCLSAANNLTYEPLCGSDGQTFHNLQAFRCYAAFFEGVRQLSVRYGACVDHPEPNHCALAFVIWRRVCGQDNRTYSSVWELMCESQRMSTPSHGSVLQLWSSCLHDGLKVELMCESQRMSTPSHGSVLQLWSSCLHDGLKVELMCESQRMSTPSHGSVLQLWSSCLHDGLKVELMCESQRMSTPPSLELMSTDGVIGEYPHQVYGPKGSRIPKCGEFNDLRRAIPVQYEGPCQHLCPVSMLYDPVCSTNMVEYPNIEAFQCDAARKPYNELSLLKEGPCPGKEEPICDGSVKDGGEVCGSNSITYSSLNQILCIRKHNPYLFILHDGACTLEDIKFPKEKAKICYFADNVPMQLPVCGTDNVTYSNPFIMKCAALRGYISEDVDVIHAGSCETDQEKNPIKEDCDKITSKMALIDEPLFCASDGRSYYSTRHYNCAVNKNSDWFNCSNIEFGLSYLWVLIASSIGAPESPRQSQTPVTQIVSDTCDPDSPSCDYYITQWHAPCQSIGVIVTDYITQWHVPCQSIGVIVTDYITQWHAPCQSIDAPCERLRSSQEGLLSQPLCASDGSSYVNSLALMCAITSQPDLTKRHKGACLPLVAPATIPPLQEDGEDT